MKITLSQLKQIIKEEAKRAINETGSKDIAAFHKMLGGMAARATELAEKDISEYTPEEIHYFTTGLETITEEWKKIISVLSK